MLLTREVIRISIPPSSMNFQVATEASFSIEDIQAIGYDAMCVIVDYVVILRRRIPSMNEERTLMLFHIPTGRAVLATWDVSYLAFKQLIAHKSYSPF